MLFSKLEKKIAFRYMAAKKEETAGYDIIRGIVPNGVAVPPFAEIKDT